MDKYKKITLSEPIESTSTKTTYEYVELKEPVLIQVKQFYDEHQKNGALSAMSLLITLLSGIPKDALNKMAFTDYKNCEVFLTGFLNYSPKMERGESV